MAVDERATVARRRVHIPAIQKETGLSSLQPLVSDQPKPVKNICFIFELNAKHSFVVWSSSASITVALRLLPLVLL